MSRAPRTGLSQDVSPQPKRRTLAGRTMVVVCAGLGAGLLFRPEFSDAESRPERPVATSAELSTAELTSLHGTAGYRRLVTELETELARLETASKKLDSRAEELFGPEIHGTRQLKLPEDHAALIRYLNNSIGFVDEVVQSFEELIPGEDQVDLKDRVPEARKHVSRLENSGVASMLARRQVRAWIQKDMRAVEALCEDWDQIQPNAQQFLATAKSFEDGGASLDQLARHYQAVQDCATSRTLFKRSKLGILCREVMEGAREIDRERTPSLVTREAAPETTLTMGPK